jgi:hypothetical protein
MAMVGCSSHLDIHKAKYESINLQNASGDLEIPHPLWQKIEVLRKPAETPAIAEKSATVNEPHSGGEATPSGLDDSSETMTMVSATVHLLEAEPGSLRGHNYEILLGKGGGTVDLANFVDTDSHADFLFGVDVPGFAEATKTKVLFLNDAHPRKIGGEVFGSSCTAFLDLTTFFTKQIAKLGQRVTTRQKLFINMMMGSYVIAFQNEERWFVTHITITDSRSSDLFCRKDVDPDAN